MAHSGETTRNLRIGAVVAVSLLIGMAFLFFIGSEQKMFARKNEYKVSLESVAGLAEGSTVQMSGVTIGTVRDIFLPRNPNDRQVDITIVVDRKYSERIRQDSRARMRKMGLIAADSLIDISPGNANLPEIPAGGIIPAQKATNVDQLIASGGDLVDNFVQISYSLKNVLERVDRGEGLLGELTSSPQNKQKLTDVLMTTLNRTNTVLEQVQSGEGVVGKFVFDEEFGSEIAGSVRQSAASLQRILASLQGGVEGGEGALPALLNDPAGRERVITILDNLQTTSENLATFSRSFQTGEGIVPRLLNDREYGEQTLREFQGLVARLNSVAAKLDQGEGTAGRLISDPTIYESINDILIGINESRLLRYLIRNRQAAGIQKRYDATRDGAATSTAPPATGTVPEPELPRDAIEPPPATSTQPPATTTTQPPG